MTTIAFASGETDPQAIKGFYERRRPLGTIIESVSHIRETPVFDENRRGLLDSSAGKGRLAVDRMPLPAPEDREGYYGDRHLEYWLSGLEDALNIKSHCAKDGCSTRRHYLDVGGCSGRVARHFLGDPAWEPWVCDINVNYIDWPDAYIPDLMALQNRRQSHLPFADGSFDVISAFSVFTHLRQPSLSRCPYGSCRVR